MEKGYKMIISTEDISTINEDLESKQPKQIIKYALDKFDNIAISFSGAEDVVLIDLALKAGKNIQVFSLDTGRLHPETYAFIETVRKHYNIDIELISPKAEDLEPFVKEKGLFSFYEDGHQQCCGVRKINPLRRRLTTAQAWITGQRKDQSPGTRQSIDVFELDSGFTGIDEQLYKFNPLANWSSEDVWNYIKMFDVPFNPLHQKGFISIGCEPCTRAVLPNQHEREGRWWWENEGGKECGLHASNIISKS